MGLYDTVRIPCPECGELYDAQSKGGPCHLDTFDMDDAPADVMMDVNRHAPYTCSCGTRFEVHTKFVVIAKTRVYREPDPEDD